MREKCVCGAEIEITGALYGADSIEGWRSRHQKCLDLNWTLMRAQAKSLRQ